MTLICLALVAIASSEFQGRSNSKAASPGSYPTLPLLYVVADRYEPLAWMSGSERFPGKVSIWFRDSQGQRLLVRGFVASADPTVSFDAKIVLFAGKQRPQDRWQIWEVPLLDGEPRQVTACPDDCIRPLYLPADRIVYARRSEGRFLIESAALVNGRARSPVVALTYGSENSWPSDVLYDGRVLFSAKSPFGPEGQPEIYTVYPDGSGVESYRCNHGSARYGARQVKSGEIVFAVSSGLGRFTSALAHEVSIAVPAGEYSGDIAENADGDWLVSWRPDQKSSFQLVRLKNPLGAEDKPVGKPGIMPFIANGTNGNVLEPVVVAERSAPKRFPSGLHDWNYANLLCLNSYTSKYKFTEGSIHAMRLYTRDTSGAAKLMGTAPVERDGSFFAQVPADQPIQIELLDGEDKTLKREAGWFWMRRGEQRVCVGCQAGPETAPENAVPMILLKSTTPTDLTGTAAQHSSGGQ